ncbi:MAG TPA: hypothetical protein VFE07_16730, partial [Marmoricola sp.]|nr:hypothetical protein [Marmoricola sp.]
MADDEPDWRRRLLLGAAVVGGALIIGSVLGLVLAGRPQHPSRAAVVAKLDPLAAGSLVAAP